MLYSVVMVLYILMTNVSVDINKYELIFLLRLFNLKYSKRPVEVVEP